MKPRGVWIDPAVSVGQGPSGPSLKVMHKGAYMGLAETWARVDAYVAAHQLKVGAAPRWEEYQSDPGTTPQDDLLTALYLPLAP